MKGRTIRIGRLPDPTRLGASAVLLDDTGTPSQVAESRYLDPARRTWIAVIATPSQIREVYEQLPGFLSLMTDLTGLSELHCSDLYNGKGCRHVRMDVRLSILGALAEIFRHCQFRFFVQTIADYTLEDLRRRGVTLPERLGPFRLTDRSWLALFTLLVQVKQVMLRNRSDYGPGALFYVDEGLWPAGRGFRAALLREVSPDECLYFCSSKKYPPLQLADFAAFAVNRMQWLAAKRTLSELDKQLLQLLEPIIDAGSNLRATRMDFEGWRPADYDALLDEDRREKGLPPLGSGESD